ncbi:MAG: hypothetical protein ABSH16_13970, partial [Sedimentisphaerales bacterium]
MKSIETQNAKRRAQVTSAQGTSILCSCALVLLLAGCSGRILNVPLVTPEQAAATTNIKSICLVEPHNKTTYPQISGDVAECLYQAIQK